MAGHAGVYAGGYQFVRVTPGEPFFIDKVRVEALKTCILATPTVTAEDPHSVFRHTPVTLNTKS